MSAPVGEPIAVHVEAAKRLLAELEQQAETALHALDHGGGADFFAAVDARTRMIGELDEVVEAIAHQRALTGSGLGGSENVSGALLAKMAHAAATALESHELLVEQTRRERDRLAAAARQAKRPDSVAHQYSVASTVPSRRNLSVTG